jgi:hypothetical protein
VKLSPAIVGDLVIRMNSPEQQAQDLIAKLVRDAKEEGEKVGYAKAWEEIVQMAQAALRGERPRPSTFELVMGRSRPVTPAMENIVSTLTMTTRRKPRGENREQILALLELTGERLGATEIIRRLPQLDLAYSSTRNALNQLLALGKVIEFDGGLYEAKLIHDHKMAAPPQSEEASN